MSVIIRNSPNEQEEQDQLIDSPWKKQNYKAVDLFSPLPLEQLFMDNYKQQPFSEQNSFQEEFGNDFDLSVIVEQPVHLGNAKEEENLFTMNHHERSRLFSLLNELKEESKSEEIEKEDSVLSLEIEKKRIKLEQPVVNKRKKSGVKKPSNAFSEKEMNFVAQLDQEPSPLTSSQAETPVTVISIAPSPEPKIIVANETEEPATKEKSPEPAPLAEQKKPRPTLIQPSQLQIPKQIGKMTFDPKEQKWQETQEQQQKPYIEMDPENEEQTSIMTTDLMNYKLPELQSFHLPPREALQFNISFDDDQEEEESEEDESTVIKVEEEKPKVLDYEKEIEMLEKALKLKNEKIKNEKETEKSSFKTITFNHQSFTETEKPKEIKEGSDYDYTKSLYGLEKAFDSLLYIQKEEEQEMKKLSESTTVIDKEAEELERNEFMKILNGKPEEKIHTLQFSPSSRFFKFLDELKNLKNLILDGNSEAISELGQLSLLLQNQLCTLSLIGAIDFPTSDSICFPKLKYLNLSQSLFTDEQINFEKFCPNLLALKLESCQLKTLKNFVFPKQLCFLNAQNNQLKQFEVDLKHLKYLNLSNNQFTNLQSIKVSQHLEYLNLSGNQIEKFDIQTEKRQQSLYLDLSNNQISSIEEEKLFPLLETLKVDILILDRNPIQSWKQSETNSQKHDLRLSGFSMSLERNRYCQLQPSFEFANMLSSCQYLILNGFQLERKFLSQLLNQTKQLKYLSLRQMSLQNFIFESPLKMTDLEYFDISWNSLTDLSWLKAPKLKIFLFQDNEIQSLSRLLEELRHCHLLEQWVGYGNGFSAKWLPDEQSEERQQNHLMQRWLQQKSKSFMTYFYLMQNLYEQKQSAEGLKKSSSLMSVTTQVMQQKLNDVSFIKRILYQYSVLKAFPNLKSIDEQPVTDNLRNRIVKSYSLLKSKYQTSHSSPSSKQNSTNKTEKKAFWISAEQKETKDTETMLPPKFPKFEAHKRRPNEKPKDCSSPSFHKLPPFSNIKKKSKCVVYADNLKDKLILDD